MPSAGCAPNCERNCFIPFSETRWIATNSLHLLYTVGTYLYTYCGLCTGISWRAKGSAVGGDDAVARTWIFFFSRVPSTYVPATDTARVETFCHLLRWAHTFHNHSLLLKRPCHLVRAVVGPHATVLPKTRRSSLLVLARPPMFNVSPMISEVRCQPRRCKQ